MSEPRATTDPRRRAPAAMPDEVTDDIYTARIARKLEQKRLRRALSRKIHGKITVTM